MSSDRRKNHVGGQKKPDGTSSAIFGVGTVAKCCELKRCADRVRSRTDNKDEVLEGKFRNLNFSSFTEKTTEYSFGRFLSIYKILDIFSQVCCNVEQSFCCTSRPKAPRDFPPREDVILTPRPRWVALGLPSPSPTVRTDWRVYVR